MRIKRISLILASTLSFSALANKQQTVHLDEISVSGNKDGRTYSETTESITVLPPSRINRGDQSNSLEVLNAQSNVQVSRNAETFSIRGVNNTGVTGYQKDNLASVFVDDIFQTDLAMRAGAFEVWDIETLEVFRGPQSTSQGVNSLAGAVLLQHASPHRGEEAAVKLGYGSFNRREMGGIINQSFLKDKLAVRLTFNKDANDGFITNKTTRNSQWGRQDKGHLVGDIKYFFDDKSELRFNNKILRTDNGGNYTIGGNAFAYSVREDQDYRSVSDNQQNSLQYIKPLGPALSNKATLAYSKSLQNNKLDADATPEATAGTRREYATDQFLSFENVLKYDDGKMKNALGLHAHQFRAFNNYDFSILFTPTRPVRVNQDVDRQRETYALFDSLLYKLDLNHALNFGMRYEIVKNSYGTYVNPLTTTGVTSIDTYLGSVRGAYDGNQTTQVFLPKIGYIYERGSHAWGLTYTQGYRIGGLDINRSRARAVKYDQEKTDNYEASWKFNSGPVKTQANIFYTHWRDQQVEVRLSNNDPYNTQVENASTSELYGGEVEGIYSLKSGETFRFGLGHVRSRFLGFNNNGTSYNGNQFPDAAQWTAQTAYGHLFTDRVSSNLTVRHVGKSYTNAENTRSSPEQLYVDLNLQYTGERFVWELNAKNLLDRHYVLNSNPVYQQTYKRVNRPREINTRITWFW